jgi:LPS export ABC transporter protein LptC
MFVRAVLPLIFIVAAVALYLSWPPREPVSGGSSPRAGAPTSVFRGVELVDQDADGTTWRLSADEGVAREAEITGRLRGVNGRFERRGRRLELKAGEAEVEQGEEVRLSGGVEMSWQGYGARLERATYHRGQGLITSSDPVEITGPGLVVTGTGVELDVEGRVAKVLTDVHAVFQGEEQ